MAAEQIDGVLAVLLDELGVAEEVHLRRADEACDEQVQRMVKDLLRRADLLNEAVAHDDDAVAQRHSLGLVVGDVDEGGVDAGAQLDDLRTHLVTQLCIEVGQRLVHQQNLRITHDGAADGDTLTLTAGQRLRLAVEVFGDAENLGGLVDLLLDLLLGDLLELQGEGHIFKHGHVRIQCIVLENHCNVSVLGRNVVDQTVADVQFALGDLLEAGDHTQGRGLAAAGRADQNDKFTILDVQRELLNGDDAFGSDLKIMLLFFRFALLALFLLGLGVRVDFLDVFQCYTCHATGFDTGASACPCLASAYARRIATGLHTAAPQALRMCFILLFWQNAVYFVE